MLSARHELNTFIYLIMRRGVFKLKTLHALATHTILNIAAKISDSLTRVEIIIMTVIIIIVIISNNNGYKPFQASFIFLGVGP
jgi:hypothetical protein